MPNVNNNKALELINNYLKDWGIKGDVKVTSSDVESIFESAEKNEDGTVSREAFDNAIAGYYSQDIQDIESDYLEAWEALAGADGDASSISSVDMSNLNEEIGDSFANSGDNYANSAGYTPPSSDAAANGITPKTSAVSLTGNETLDELRAGRSDALSQLSDMKGQKAEAEKAIQAQHDAVDDKKEAYDEALETLESDDEDVQAQIDDIRARKEDKKAQIESQNGVIEDINSSITSEQDRLAGIQSELDGLVEPSKSDFTTTDEEGKEVFDEAAYNAALQEYNDKKAELEAEKAASEEALASLEENLSEAEDALTVLENEDAAIDEELNKLLNSEDGAKIENKTAVQQALTDYNDAKDKLQEAEQENVASIDAEIAQIQDNLSTYNDAITTKEAEESQKEKEDDSAPSATDEDGNGLPDYLQENEHIIENEDGTYSIDIPAWADSNGFSCPSSIMKQIYGLDWGTPEANKVYEALVQANKSNGTLTGTPSNPGTYVGKAVLVDAEAVLNGTADPNNPPLAKKPEPAAQEQEEDTKVTLSADEVNEVVDKLLGNAQDADGNKILANDAWDSMDFSEYSPETIAQIAAKYDESGKDFIEKAEKMYKADNEAEAAQYDAIVSGLVADAAENENTMQMVSDNIDKAIENGDTRFIDSLIKSQENSLGKLQSVISSYEDTKGISLAEALPDYADEINNIKSSMDIADEVLQKIKAFDEAIEGGNLTDFFDEIEGMDDDELAEFVDSYNYVHKDDGSENPFMDVAKSFYTLNEYDKIVEAINTDVPEDTEITAETELSDGRNVQEVVDSLKGDLRDADIDNLTAEDIAMVLNYEDANIDIESLLSEAEDSFGKTDYSTLNERLEAIDLDSVKSPEEEVDMGVTNEKAIAAIESLEDTMNQIAQLEAEGLTDTQVYKESLANSEKIINEALADPEIPPQERMKMLEHIAQTNSELVKNVLTNPQNMESVVSMFETISNGTEGVDGKKPEYDVEDAIEFSDKYTELSGQSLFDLIGAVQTTTIYDGVGGSYEQTTSNLNNNSKIGQRFVDALINLYENAKPEEIQTLNSTFNTADTIQKLLARSVETDKLQDLMKIMDTKIPDSMKFTEDELKTNEYVLKAKEEKYNSMKKILEAVQNGELDSKTALYLINKKHSGNPEGIATDFRNMSSEDEEKYLSVLLNLYGIPNEEN